MKLRVGLVGLGPAWQGRHRPALLALSDRFDVRAVCEPVFARAEQAARDFQSTAVHGFRALVMREDVDAILMLSRQWYGALPILAACEQRKAIYSASGLEVDPAQSDRIKQRVEESGVAFMAEMPCRQAPATLRLKELIATRLGAPQLLFCHHRETVEQRHRSTDPLESEESPLHHLVELVDWCRFVVAQEPSSVYSVLHRGKDCSDEDYQMLSMDFSPVDRPGSGPAAQISCGRYIPEAWSEATSFRPPSGLQVKCENGIAFVDLPSTLVWFDKAGRHHESLESDRPVGEQLLSHFHRAVTSLVRQTSSLEDAYRALSIVMRGRESHAQGARILLDP